MQLPSLRVLGACYGIFELAVSVLLRSKHGNVTRHDQGTLALIWVVVSLSLLIAIVSARLVPLAALPRADAFYPWGVGLLMLGIAVRAYSIWYLGRFFTVDVVVASDQIVIDTGPYRYVRHPSYLGACVAFFGIGLCMGNVVSMMFLLLPIGCVFARRMDVEEAVLARTLGEPYVAYMQRTKRLIPFLY